MYPRQNKELSPQFANMEFQLVHNSHWTGLPARGEWMMSRRIKGGNYGSYYIFKDEIFV